MHLLYIIGEPGSGKTTLADHLTRLLPYEETLSPVPFRRYDCGVTELGRHRPGGFSGTDAMSMSIQPAVLRFLESMQPKLVLAEGDRLANSAFFKGVEALGYTLWVYRLFGPDIAVMQRRIRGSDQNVQWLRGRQTKDDRLAKQWLATELPAGSRLDHLELRMTSDECPVVMSLVKARELVSA